MKPTLRTKLDSLVGRLGDVNKLLAAENATRDMEQFKRLSREYAELSDVVALFQKYREAEGDADAAKELGLDEELKSARASMGHSFRAPPSPALCTRPGGVDAEKCRLAPLAPREPGAERDHDGHQQQVCPPGHGRDRGAEHHFASAARAGATSRSAISCTRSHHSPRVFARMPSACQVTPLRA